MKPLLLFLLAFAALPVFAREYHVYKVAVDKGTNWNPITQSVRAPFKHEGVTVQRFAILKSIRRGTYVANNVYTVTYANQVDRLGEPIEDQKRDVGVNVELQEEEFGAKLTYYSADLEKWEVTGDSPLLQPVFDTFELEGKLSFAKSNIAVFGGIVRKNVTVYIIIQRID